MITVLAVKLDSRLKRVKQLRCSPSIVAQHRVFLCEKRTSIRMRECITTLLTILLAQSFVSITNAFYVGGNFGMCLTYPTPVAGMPVYFVKCSTQDPKQSNWLIKNLPNGAQTICANGVNLCLSITKSWIGKNMIGVLNYTDTLNPPESQQFTYDATTFEFTNIESGLCITNNGILLMKICDQTNQLQPMFIYGPAAPNRSLPSDLESSRDEDYDDNKVMMKHGDNSPVTSPYSNAQMYSSWVPYHNQYYNYRYPFYY